jgi:predicted MFS family arabinose efflux permease
LYAQPSLWLFYVAMFAWGLNMGVTTTLVRSTVQELAEPNHRAQILSILLVSFMITAPVSSLLLGLLIQHTTPLSALLPGVVMSFIIFFLGRYSGGADGLWHYRSALAGGITTPSGASRDR